MASNCMLLDLFNRVAAINIPFAVGAESNIRAVCLLKLLEFFGAFKFELAILNWALHSVNSERDNVRVIPDAGDVVFVGADKIAKLSAQTPEPRSFAAWDQRIVIWRYPH